MADITLADIVAWEPRLRPLDPAGLNGWGDREISWTIAARTSSPMLPSIRGGELVLLPGRAVADSGVALPVLLRELAGHGAGGVVLDQAPVLSAPLPVLIAEVIAPELESDLNRLLTERRGELYRAGTDLGRLMINAGTAGSDLGAVVTIAAEFLGVPVAVLDRRGAALASAGGAPLHTPLDGDTERGWAGDRLLTRLANGETLAIGPAPKSKRALIRLGAERVALAADAAIQRAADARPRGPARATALTTLLTGGAADPIRAASLLGLTSSGAFRVALASPDADPQVVQRLLNAQGNVIEAAAIDRCPAALIEVRSDAAAASPRSSASARRDGTTLPRGWLAFSGVANGVGDLIGAANEARFAASLLNANLIRPGVVRFDSLSDLGPYRLLHRFWGSSDLDGFARDALGELPARDRRGTLRKTLLVYLETGGSHVDAAARLDIHRNTLAYRLRQIATLTSRDPADPATWLVLHLALLAASLPPNPARASSMSAQ